ncbi:MAG TPA: T9SS type A sorting domain-containing protein, partial [Chitinophagaceae bacterium]|nr:T9SS type A sorting domain-containing protein [Chitinophagaceae bacterium]
DKSEKVSVTIFDITGRKIKDPFTKTFPQGKNHVQWNTSGTQAGIYFLKIDAGIYSVTKTISVIK